MDEMKDLTFLVVRMLSWGASRATLLVFTGGDAAVVRGV
jgi:hypothetical protein